MTILYVLQVLAIGLAVAGLVAVVLEIALKDPSAFREIAADTARFANPGTASRADSAEPVRIRHSVAAPAAPLAEHRNAA